MREIHIPIRSGYDSVARNINDDDPIAVLRDLSNDELMKLTALLIKTYKDSDELKGVTVQTVRGYDANPVIAIYHVVKYQTNHPYMTAYFDFLKRMKEFMRNERGLQTSL